MNPIPNQSPRTGEAAHTPTPHQFSQLIPVQLDNGPIKLIDERGCGVAVVRSNKLPPQVTKARAAFIIRACHSHDALLLFVENAERRAKYIAGMDPNDSRIPRLLQEQRDEAAHVLQLAKEVR